MSEDEDDVIPAFTELEPLNGFVLAVPHLRKTNILLSTADALNHKEPWRVVRAGIAQVTVGVQDGDLVYIDVHAAFGADGRAYEFEHEVDGKKYVVTAIPAGLIACRIQDI